MNWGTTGAMVGGTVYMAPYLVGYGLSATGPDAHAARTAMTGADSYETPDRKVENRRQGLPDVGIGPCCRVEGAIIDKNARAEEGVIIRPHEAETELVETKDYAIQDGIVVIPKNAVIPDGTVI